MRVARIKDVENILKLKEKMEKVVNDNFTKDEIYLMVEMSEDADEMFWDIMTNAFDKYRENVKEDKFVWVNESSE